MKSPSTGRRGGFGFYTHGSRWISAGLSYDWGQQINFAPAGGLPPFLGQGDDLSLRLTLRPTARLAVENSLLESRLTAFEQGQSVFNNNILRSKLNYQFTKRFSLRLIGQYANVLPAPSLSSLEYTKNLAGDFLLTYLAHPGTAVYVGYSNILENYDRVALARRSGLERSPRDLLSTTGGLFVKVSYQYSF